MRVWLVAAALLFSACAELSAPAPLPQLRAESLPGTAPTCVSGRECELKWSAARQWVLANAGMKLQHITADFMETYNPAAASRLLAVRVVKEPLSEGGYQIAVTTWCNNAYVGCLPSAGDAVRHFNSHVNAAVPASSPERPIPSAPMVRPPAPALLPPTAPREDAYYIPTHCREPGDVWDRPTGTCRRPQK